MVPFTDAVKSSEFKLRRLPHPPFGSERYFHFRRPAMSAPGATPVQRYAAWVAAAMQAQGRDDSHGMLHFERVRAAALGLAAASQRLSAAQRLILELAALSHDVLDHKYVAGDVADLRQAMKVALTEEAGLSLDAAGDVCLIAENVSMSKELRGETAVSALQSRGLLELRDLVSDADKLDALGLRGVERLAQYQAHVLRQQGRDAALLTVEFLREMVAEHLLHRAAHLKTAAARVQGERLLLETHELMASDAALGRIVEAFA